MVNSRSLGRPVNTERTHSKQPVGGRQEIVLGVAKNRTQEIRDTGVTELG